MVIPKLLNWKRANFNVTYQGTLSLNGSNMQGSSVPTLRRTRSAIFPGRRKCP